MYDSLFVNGTMGKWNDEVLFFGYSYESGTLTTCKIITKIIIVVFVNKSYNEREKFMIILATKGC